MAYYDTARPHQSLNRPHRVGADGSPTTRRDGYLFPLHVFSPAEADAWADEALTLAIEGIGDHPVPWNQKSYLLLPSLDDLVRDPRLTDRVAAPWVRISWP